MIITLHSNLANRVAILHLQETIIKLMITTNQILHNPLSLSSDESESWEVEVVGAWSADEE